LRTYIRAIRIAAEKAAAYLGIFADLPPFVTWLVIQAQPLVDLVASDPTGFAALGISLLALMVAIYAATRGKPPML
jgi:hypothetical protein